MDQLTNWISTFNTFAGTIGTLVTAVATFCLWRVTRVLANETTRMVEASSQPHVVATLSPSRWSTRHFELCVANTGNATAYEVQISFTPSLPTSKNLPNVKVPLQQISVLKPERELSSYLCEYVEVKGKQYEVTISWTRQAKSGDRETNAYTLDMADIENMGKLGDEPLVTVANSLKKMQESLAHVADGKSRVQVDSFSNTDREREFAEEQEQRRIWREEALARTTTQNSTSKEATQP